MAIRCGLVVILLAGACSSDSSGGGPIPVDQLEDAFTAYRCNALARCGLVESVSVCRSLRVFGTSSLGSLFTVNQVEAAKNGLITYDGTAAGVCLAGYFSTCDQSYFSTDRARPEECDHVFTPTAGSGAACGTDEECISSYCSLTAQCMGTCSGAMPPPPRPKLGESCVMSSNCIDSYCDGSTQVCTTYLKANQPCTSDAQCEPGLAMRNGLCAALAATGDPCSSSTDCESIGDYCNGTCTKYGLTDDMCVADSQCSPVYRCDTISSTCVLRPIRGQACTPFGQFGCIDDSYCDQSTSICTALLADGATCDPSSSTSECESGYCYSTTGTSGMCMSSQVCF